VTLLSIRAQSIRAALVYSGAKVADVSVDSCGQQSAEFVCRWK
jgi:hypothetical protein